MKGLAKGPSTPFSEKNMNIKTGYTRAIKLKKCKTNHNISSISFLGDVAHHSVKTHAQTDGTKALEGIFNAVFRFKHNTEKVKTRSKVA